MKVNETVTKVYGKYPETVLQFGEGNFLRAFADWMIEDANEKGFFKGSVVICQPLSQISAPALLNQDCVYTVAMRGLQDGKPEEKFKKITSVSRCLNLHKDFKAFKALAKIPTLKVIISNTTEAGIVYREGDKLTDTPPVSFPAKVTLFLYERYKNFKGAQDKGFLFLPVELIDDNGNKLKEIVLRYAKEWQLEDAFIEWIEKANKFTNTLVDRIVTGHPKDMEEFEAKLGYEDNALVTCEFFNLWVIEGKKEWAGILPINKGKPHVIWTDNVKPYKTRKVRILNGGHTSTVLAAYLAGHNIVLDFMKDSVFHKYIKTLLFSEVIPSLDSPKAELEAFANDVLDRFSNPFIKHNLLDISLNSSSKFAVRCLPSLLEYRKKTGKLPKLLTFSLAAFIEFYKISKDGEAYFGKRADGTKYQVKDDPQVLDFFANAWASGDTAKVAHDVLANTALWGQDLSKIPALEQHVAAHLTRMQNKPMHKLVEDLTK